MTNKIQVLVSQDDQPSTRQVEVDWIFFDGGRTVLGEKHQLQQRTNNKRTMLAIINTKLKSLSLSVV